MKLTNENYFSIEADREYMSNSQYGTFMDCEARAMAEINREYVRNTTTSLLVGSYIDAYFSGTLDSFKIQTPEIFTLKGELRADYKHAEKIIERIERDEKFMKYMDGEKQVIRTGEIDGIPWKIKIDVLHDGICSVDLKIVKDFEPIWHSASHAYISWVEFWNYHRQAAIYQHIEGNMLPFVIAAATKEKTPDIALLGIPQETLDFEYEKVAANAPRFAAIKRGEIEPLRCERCEYCRETKKLDNIISYEELI